MNIQNAARIKPDEDIGEARIDLAASHRLAVMHGLSEGISNHFTVMVPHRPDRFFAIPCGMHWSEVTASALLTVDMDGNVVDGEGQIERSSFCIHAPIHRRNPKAACILHTHMPYASALTRLEDPQIQALGQTEIAFLDQIAYDEHYDGLARDPSEGERLADILGDKSVLFMGGHGVLVIGATVGQAYDSLYFLERACLVQVLAMSTGRKLKQLPPDVIAKTKKQFSEPIRYDGKSFSSLHFLALRRLLDRQEPDYRK